MRVPSLLGLVAACIISSPSLGQEAKNSDNKQEIEELIIVGDTPEETTEIRSDTELLFNVAGAGLDPLASIQSLPGVTFTNDFSSEPAVRGSSPSDNNYYIDLVPARYVFHLFGHSIFNHNLIHSFDLYPAAFSSQFSNATGAIIDVRLRDPRQDEFRTTLDASFIGSAAMIETGLWENAGIYASFRRSLIDQFIDEDDLDTADDGVEIGQLPISDDYQIKSTWDYNDQQRLTFLAAGASDKTAATLLQNSNVAIRDPDLLGPAKLNFSFDSQGLIWDWNSSNDLQQASLILTHTREDNKLSYGTGQLFDIGIDRNRVHGRYQFQLGSHSLIIGSSVENAERDLEINAKIPACSQFDPDCPTIDAPLIQYNDAFDIQSTIAYVEDVWALGDTLSIRTGVHYLTDDFLDDTQVEPRLRMDLRLGEKWELYAAHGLYSQIPRTEEISPATGNPNLEYIQSTHSVVGLKQHFGRQWSWQLDMYYKKMEQLPLSLSSNRDPDFLNRFSNDASGEAYGIEFLLNKNLTDKLYGWVALSLAESKRTNERTGQESEFQYDKPVILNVVGNYKLSDSWIFGLKWSLQSGALYSPIVSTRPNTNDPSIEEPVYGELNSERLPFYHRLDLRLEYSRETGFGGFSFYVDVLNAYNSSNVQGYRYAPNGNDTLSNNPDGFGDDVPVTESQGLPFFPSLGFKIYF